ncbi:MAG: hypothetical protein WDZ47_01215 [Bacteroidales bacterium]
MVQAAIKLPLNIIPYNINYKIHFVEEYVKGKKIDFPESIRHISPKRLYDFPEYIPYKRPNLLIISNKYENRKISKEAIEELLKKFLSEN